MHYNRLEQGRKVAQDMSVVKINHVMPRPHVQHDTFIRNGGIFPFGAKKNITHVGVRVFRLFCVRRTSCLNS